MPLTDLLIIALAAWRLAYMLTSEDGPLAVFKRARDTLMKRAMNNDYDLQPGTWGALFSCVYCMSIWTGAVCYGLWFTPLQPVVIVLAVSAVGLMLASYTGLMRDY